MRHTRRKKTHRTGAVGTRVKRTSKPDPRRTAYTQSDRKGSFLRVCLVGSSSFSMSEVTPFHGVVTVENPDVEEVRSCSNSPIDRVGQCRCLESMSDWVRGFLVSAR